VDAPLEEYCVACGINPQDFMLAGGEDYELLFALSADNLERTLEHFRDEFRTEICVIGKFTREWTGVRVSGEVPSHLGYDQFK